MGTDTAPSSMSAVSIGGVVDAGEPEDGDAVAGLHRVVVPGVGDGLDAVAELAVGDGRQNGAEAPRWCGHRRR